MKGESNWKRKKLIVAFGDRYSISRMDDGRFLLYDRGRKSIILAIHYLGCFTLNDANKTYVFNGAEYASVNELVAAMDGYNAGLKYNHEYFNPQFMPHVAAEYVGNDYLKSIGLTLSVLSGGWHFKDLYDKVQFVLFLKMKNDGTDAGSITVCNGDNNDTSFETIPFHGVDEVIPAINSVIYPRLLVKSGEINAILSQMSDSRTDNGDTITVNASLQSFNVSKRRLIDDSIERLETEIARLKALRDSHKNLPE